MSIVSPWLTFLLLSAFPQRACVCAPMLFLASNGLAKDDPRRVVIVEMHVIFEDRPAGDVVFKGLDQQANLDKLKKSAVVFKESCHYKLKFVFRVQHDIVTGLRYHNGVYKTGIRGTIGLPFSLPSRVQLASN